MKIGFTGVDLPEGKIKYNDENLVFLEKKDKPKKLSPFLPNLCVTSSCNRRPS